MAVTHQSLYDSIIEKNWQDDTIGCIFELQHNEKEIHRYHCCGKDLFYKINPLEKEALSYLKKHERILDLGAGGGRISAHLQKKGYNITALDKSKSACRVLKKRGIKRIINADIFRYSPRKQYDAVLFIDVYSIFGRKKVNILNFLRRLREKVIAHKGRLFVILSDTKSGTVEIMKRRFICAGEVGSWFVSLHPSFGDIVKSAQDSGFKIEKIKKNKVGEYFLILKRL